jgi:hypothetical protein
MSLWYSADTNLKWYNQAMPKIDYIESVIGIRIQL